MITGRKVLVLVSFALIILVCLVTQSVGNTAHASQTNDGSFNWSIYYQQQCSTDYPGKIKLVFTWTPLGEGGQWLDLSWGSSFAPGTYAGYGPLAPDTSTAVWDGLDSLTTIFGRINTATSSGWKTSSVFYFRTGQCPAGHEFPVVSSFVSGKQIILTFDDCADPGRISDILDVLHFFGAKAVFFPTGQCSQSNAALFEKAIADGNLIGNHTYSHPHLTQLSDNDVAWQIQNGPAQALGGYFRPPYFEHSARIDAIAVSLGYKLMMWNIDSNDYDATSASSIINRVVSAARPGAIVSMHMQGPNTLEALPWIIYRLANAGYVVAW